MEEKKRHVYTSLLSHVVFLFLAVHQLSVVGCGGEGGGIRRRGSPEGAEGASLRAWRSQVTFVMTLAQVPGIRGMGGCSQGSGALTAPSHTPLSLLPSLPHSPLSQCLFVSSPLYFFPHFLPVSLFRPMAVTMEFRRDDAGRLTVHTFLDSLALSTVLALVA